jgi:hypothetical protein
MTVNEHPFEYIMRIIGTYRLFKKYFNYDVMNNFIIEGPNCKVKTTMKVTNKVALSFKI